jgi:hypothetical protein
MGLLNRLTRYGGARVSRRLSRSLPLVGTALAFALAARAARSKGIVRGAADTGLNAMPVVGTIKNLIEVFTGDWFADKPRPRRRRS